MKTIKNFVIIFSIYLIVIGLLIFATSWSNESKSLITQYAAIIVTGVGFIIAIYQLRLSAQKYFNDLEKKERDYLDLLITTKAIDNVHSIITQVVNKSGENQMIDYSFLLISKQDSNIIDVLNFALEKSGIIIKIEYPEKVDYSNEFNIIKNHITKPLFIDNEIGIIPLNFYYSENIGIGNESPGYTYSFDNTEIKLKKGIYSVRFFIFPSKGYHRSTADSVIIK